MYVLFPRWAWFLGISVPAIPTAANGKKEGEGREAVCRKNPGDLGGLELRGAAALREAERATPAGRTAS